VVAVVVILRIVEWVICSVGLATAFLLISCSPAATTSSHNAAPIEVALEVPKIDGGNTESPGAIENGVRFGRTLTTVGSKWTVDTDARSSVTLVDAQGQPDLQLSEYISRYAVEVLAVEGPAPTRVRLSFQKNVQRYQNVDKATVIDGKTYVLDRATQPQVRLEDGSPATEDESQRVLDVFPDLGTRTQIDQVLPDGVMTFGQDRHELAEAILRVIHPRAWTLVKGTATLLRAEGSTDAVFDVALDAKAQSGVHMDVKGEARVRIRDAKLVAISLSGSYLTGKGESPGAFTLKRTVRDH